MGWFDDLTEDWSGDIGNWINDTGSNILGERGNGIGGFVEGWVDMATFGQYGLVKDAFGNLMPKPPDYSGPLDAAQQQLFEEKRRRANEANRKDARGSQLAKLFLSEDGTNFNTPNSFMG